MNLTAAANAAMSTPGGTPEYHLATELCIVRGIDPNGYRSTAGCMPPMPNWQMVIAEQLIQDALQHAMAQPAR